LFYRSAAGEFCEQADTYGTQVTETPEKKEAQADKPPEAASRGASSRVPAIVVSLAALAITGAAIANFSPIFHQFSLPKFSGFSLPNFDRFAFSLPSFDRVAFSLPNFDRFTAQPVKRIAAQPAKETASIPIPDPAVTGALRDIQSSQQQSTAVLASLTQSSATQQADLKRISRQLSALAAQTEALQNSVTPLTTSSIPHSNPRARVVGTSRKIIPSLPKPVGPVSVGGAPLSPVSAPGSRAG
jgi:hypothetical protein